MSFLTDSELKRLIGSVDSPIRGVDLSGDLDSIRSQIQPCSVDLRISEVFLPFRTDETDVGKVHRTYRYDLDVGETVRVATCEEFELNNHYGALVVAPARLTRRGILVPDVGHVDPGFSGPLRMTIINMGRNRYEVKSGDVIVTVLLFRLDTPVDVGLRDRTGGPPPYEEGRDTKHLSPDFLDIERRASCIAVETTKAVLRGSGWIRAFVTLFLPIIVGILAALITYYISVESRLSGLEVESKMFTEHREFDGRISQLESQVNDLTDPNTGSAAASTTQTTTVPQVTPTP